MGFRGGGVGNATSLFELAPDGELVPVSFYGELYKNSTETSFGVPAGTTNNTRTYMGNNGPAIIRRGRKAKKIKVQTGAQYTGNIGNIVSIKARIFRKDFGDGFYDQVGADIDLTAGFSAVGANDTDYEQDISSSNIVMQTGDRVAFEIITDGSATSGIIKALDGGNASSTFFINGTLGNTDIDFEGVGTANDAAIKCQIFMNAPWGLWVGDSLGEDASQNGFLNKLDVNISYGEMLSQRLQNDGFIGLEIDNMSLGATSTLANILSNINDRILDIKPKVVFFVIGTNDLFQNTLLASMQNDYTSIISQMISAGITPILFTVFPRTSLSDAQQLNREAFNDFIKSTGRSNKLLVIDLDAKLGTKRLSIDSHNNYDLKPSFTGDGTHLNTTGQSNAVDEIYQQFIAHEKAVQLINSL